MFAAEDDHHLDAGPRQHDEEDENDGLGEQRHREPEVRRHGVDEAGHADMGAAQRGQRRAVIGEPDEADGGEFVVPGQCVPDIAEDEAGNDQQRQAGHEDDDDGFKQPLEARAHAIEVQRKCSLKKGAGPARGGPHNRCRDYLPRASDLSINSLPPGTSLANSS